MTGSLSRWLLTRLCPAEHELQRAVIGLVWHLGSHDVCTPAELARVTASMEIGPRTRLLRLIEGVAAQDAGPPEARAWLSTFTELARSGTEVVDLGR